MADYKSPGVYVEEIPLLPPSIAEVDSAVPAFVGYTEKATNLVPDDLHNVPTPISSLKEYEQYFGGPEKEDVTHITVKVDELQKDKVTTGFKVSVTPDVANMSKHILYQAIKHFYANGGGSCYIVSVGKYSSSIAKDDLEAGLELIANEDAPTMLVVPEAIYLNDGDFKSVIQKMNNQAATLKDRFAIIDTRITTVPKGSNTVATDAGTAIDNIVSDNDIRRFGAVYYPFLETTYNYEFAFDTIVLTHHVLNNNDPVVPGSMDKKPLSDVKNSASTMYNAIAAEYGKYHIVLPPSAAMAGVYTRVDKDRGVWKAPANVGVMNVVKPVVSISTAEHGALNINTTTGKSVNAILNIPGYGTVVMGARTLDGNNNEWKYINVRRFFSVVEESVKRSTGWAVFEPNTASTWVKVQAMIENYLFLKWRDGALAGAKPEQAFFVRVGLGKTMNSIDVLEGRMIVQIGMAVARPAEFIILQFEQMLQTS